MADAIICIDRYKCSFMFVGECLKYGFKISFMSSTVASRKILTLTKFVFVPESPFSSISWSIESPATNIAPFVHWVGVVGAVLLTLFGNSLCDMKLFSYSC